MASSAAAEGEERGAVQTMEVTEDLQHPAEKVWQAYVHDMESMLVAAVPGHVSSVSYENGPPLTVGSLVVLSYHKDVTHYDCVKLRWDEMDHARHRFKCTLVSGGALHSHFSHLAYIFSITPGSSPTSCIMHYTIEFVDIGEHSFHDFIKYELQVFCKSLDSLLHNIKD